MIPKPFEYHAPDTLEEAIRILRRHRGEAKVLAGGHSLIPMMKLRLAEPAILVDLGRIPGLAYVREQDGVVQIGAMTTYTALARDPVIRRRLPVIAEAVSVIADVQVRNRGTIGGSLAHADPAGDMPAVVLALEGRLHARGGGRERVIPAERFFLDTFTTALRETEILTRIDIPVPPERSGASYQKFANRASHYAVVGVAALVTLDASGVCSRVRIGITGAGPVALRARRAERYLEGKEPTDANIARTADRAVRAVEEFQSDLHASAEYREYLTRVLTRRALSSAVARARA